MSWLDKEVDNIFVSTWLAPDMTCPRTPENPFGMKFIVKEGMEAVRKHAMTAKHKTNYAKSKNVGQLDMETALQNQKELQSRTATENRQLLEGQILFSNFAHTHGLPSESFTCFGKLVNKIFPDSNIAKRWYGSQDGMRRTKGDYFLTHGTYAFYHQMLVNTLKKSFFSINVDEGGVNRKSQLDINVSYVDTVKKGL